MTVVTEGRLEFEFAGDCRVSKYDAWSFYRNQFHSIADSSKAIDIVCIEVRDYRQHPRDKAIDIADEVAAKARDTLAGLAAARCNADESQEREHARQALAARKWRIVLQGVVLVWGSVFV